jgi:uncharacterized membrane protein YbhN (UPF0104 family)
MASTTDREPRLHPGWLALLAVVALLSVYGVATAVGGLGTTWSLVRSADPAWMAPAALAEAGSYTGWIVLLRTVAGDARVGWAASARITLAGVAALLVALYGVFLAALALLGTLLYAGVLHGPAPASLTLVPAAFAAAVMATVVVLAATTTRPRRPGARGAARAGWLLAAGPRLLGEGLRRVWTLARRREPGLAGALLWWACDAVALWCGYRAFGGTPALGVLAVAYLVGQLGNLLPFPGGAGGVDGALIGALIALGAGPGDAALAVLAYRGISFWLPTAPGVAAYLSLRRNPARAG